MHQLNSLSLSIFQTNSQQFKNLDMQKKMPFICDIKDNFYKMDDQKDNFCFSKDSESSLSNSFENKNCATNDDRKHLLTNVEESFTCDTCKKTFLQYRYLKSHSRIHLPIICCICQESFSSLSLLKKHEISHLGPYCCNICSKAFSKICNLKIHFKVHPGGKPCICYVCGKAFLLMSQLRVHLRVHSKKKHYGCALCNRQFTQLRDLKRHCDIHFGDRLNIQNLSSNGISQSFPLKVPPQKPKKAQKLQTKSPKKVVKPFFWDTLRKGFSKSYLRDQRQALGKSLIDKDRLT